MKALLRRILRYLAFEHGRAVGWYKRFCNPGGDEWAAWLKRRGVLYAIGEHCSIQTNVTIADPTYTRLGNNVRLTGCTLFGHDGSVNMLNRAYGLKLDRVGKIDIRDNVFIGHGAIILPGVTIGPNAIVAAGSVINRDVPPGSIVAGTPARVVGDIDRLVARLRQDTARLPWADILARRDGAFDLALQNELDRVRIPYFFGGDIGSPPAA
ncbi:MAG: acyltransferase [Candidatus Competibacter sp.]|nr:acyltransferase [Candidatus Competibacter sp.]MDG4583314.1 acyltransferase [Candidatus Competibacter sp.]